MKKTFDLLNFFYGFGAAVVLVAAMFKFLGWPFANEFFIVGLTTESLVFLVSAFAWKKKNKDYKWENIFPGLTSEKNQRVTQEGLDKAKDVQLDTVAKSVGQLNMSIEKLSEITLTLTETVKTADNNYKKFSESNQQYQQELEKLRNKLASANESLGTFEKFKN